MEKSSKIYVAGNKGLVGSAIIRQLIQDGYTNIITRISTELDLRNQSEVSSFFSSEKPEYVFLAAAKVGGIMANKTCPAEFIHDNLAIQSNVIHQAWLNGVKKLMFLGSSCIYPRDSQQPIKEEYLLTGSLEKTNEPYAVAKIAGIKMCQSYNQQYGPNFICVMPTNLYGPEDNYNLQNSHVLPALIRKFHGALPDKPVVLWGSGSPRREFLHVNDLASACCFLMHSYNSSEIINIGTGEDITICELASIVQQVVGHKGPILWDKSMPDGTPRKLLDVSKLQSLGWIHHIGLRQGISDVYNLVDKEGWK